MPEENKQNVSSRVAGVVYTDLVVYIIPGAAFLLAAVLILLGYDGTVSLLSRATKSTTAAVFFLFLLGAFSYLTGVLLSLVRWHIYMPLTDAVGRTTFARVVFQDVPWGARHKIQLSDSLARRARRLIAADMSTLGWLPVGDHYVLDDEAGDSGSDDESDSSDSDDEVDDPSLKRFSLILPPGRTLEDGVVKGAEEPAPLRSTAPVPSPKETREAALEAALSSCEDKESLVNAFYHLLLARLRESGLVLHGYYERWTDILALRKNIVIGVQFLLVLVAIKVLLCPGSFDSEVCGRTIALMDGVIVVIAVLLLIACSWFYVVLVDVAHYSYMRWVLDLYMEGRLNAHEPTRRWACSRSSGAGPTTVK